jgi:hypothetical protein
LIETFSEMPDFLHKRGNRRALFPGNEARTRQSLNRIRGVIVQWTAQTDQGWMRHGAHARLFHLEPAHFVVEQFRGPAYQPCPIVA